MMATTAPSGIAGLLLLAGLAAAAPIDAQEAAMDDMTLSSPAFASGEAIPARYTADGEDVHPPLVISGAPEGTVSFALVVDDPDAPRGTWVHWVVWNLPGDLSSLPAGELPGGVEVGRNSWGKREWGGPSPPSGTHRYFFKLYALDSRLDLPPGADKDSLEGAMRRHVLDRAELMGTYSR